MSSSSSASVYYNSKRRVIHVGPRGGRHVFTASGRKRYGIVAHYKKTGDGEMISLGIKRKTRKNAGVKRKARDFYAAKPRAKKVLKSLIGPKSLLAATPFYATKKRTKKVRPLRGAMSVRDEPLVFGAPPTNSYKKRKAERMRLARESIPSQYWN